MKQDGNRITCRKGEVIFRQGDYEIFMYDILKGEVEIWRDYGLPTQKKLTTLYDGEMFGEMGLVDSMPRSATAVAADETTLARIDNVAFGEYFEDKPAKVMKILQNLSSRMRSLTQDYMDACHTISEYLEAEDKGEEKSEDLISRMKKFVGVYKKNRR